MTVTPRTAAILIPIVTYLASCLAVFVYAMFGIYEQIGYPGGLNVLKAAGMSLAWPYFLIFG